MRQRRNSGASDAMHRIIIIGAGGHGRVVADALRRMRPRGEGVPIGFADDRKALHGQEIMGLPVLGGIECLDRHAHDRVIVAIGDCATRARLYHLLTVKGERFASVQHESSVIGSEVYFGPGTMVLAGVIVNTGTHVGSNVILNTGCVLEHDNTVGDHVHIAPRATLGGEVTVGSSSLIGIGATVLPRLSIGERSVVGAGALVVEDVRSDVKVKGVPARPFDAGVRFQPP